MKRKRTVQERMALYRQAKHGERLFALQRLRDAATAELRAYLRAKRRARG